MAPIDINELKAAERRTAPRNCGSSCTRRSTHWASARKGLGGLTTVLDVKVLDYPTHAVLKPVAIVPNCAATRHIEFHLDGSGPARFEAPSLDNWPRIALDLGAGATRVDLEKLTKAGNREVEGGRPAAAQRKDPDGPRRRPQAPDRSHRQGRERCPSTSGIASSTTSDRWTRCATRSSAPPAPPPPAAWTSSWTPCSGRPGCSARSESPSAARRPWRRSSGTRGCT